MVPDHKRKERCEIKRLTMEYIKNGGTIDKVDHTSNKSYKAPIKRDRTSQVDHQKRNWNLSPKH